MAIPDSLFPIPDHVFRIDALVLTHLAPLPIQLRDVTWKELVLGEELFVVADREHRPVTASTRQILHGGNERTTNTHALRVRRDRERPQLREARRVLVEMRAADDPTTAQRHDEVIGVRRDELLRAGQQRAVADVEIDESADRRCVSLGGASNFHFVAGAERRDVESI